MTKKYTALDSLEWDQIVKNIKGLYTSDGTMSVLLDFERVLDDSDLYAFKNWQYGELVDGPVLRRYDVSATFKWPLDMMPNPRGAKRLLTLGCKVLFKKTTIKEPIVIRQPDDYLSGTHYPKMIERSIWLVNITIPKRLLNTIREGSVDIANQTIDIETLNDSYQKDYDKISAEDANTGATAAPGGMPMGGLGGPPMGLGGPPMGLGGPPL